MTAEFEGWPNQRLDFFNKLETAYKAPFPAVSEETLAGNLSNTIAGRICNHYDLKGGGYTLDGACSSSLLAVSQACTALMVGDLDVALAGGVDLSLDPFELVGFAKAGALAAEEMRVYDARAAGFWPGEGCGFVTLMRQADALAQQRPIYAVIRGWGISSDGNGGMTRPEVDGQLLALGRAYERAGFGAETVSYFEGHGTGTSVGDTTELTVLSQARTEPCGTPVPAVLSSIKANIGHTKAAAGLAGLIKAVMALKTQVLPPMTACEQPHPQLMENNANLRVLAQAESWPDGNPLRASVSAMGFGGINTHLALENPTIERRQRLTPHERSLSTSAQDCELFLLSAETSDALLLQVEHLLTLAPRLSRSELIDLAAELEKTLGVNVVRAAIIAATPSEFTQNLESLRFCLENRVESQFDCQSGVFLGTGNQSPKIGFLFPGQASPSYLSAGAWGRRFSSIQTLYQWANLPQDGDRIATEVAQPAIMTASMAGLQLLARLGIEADVGVGHSLGELAALHWSGVWDRDTLLRIATARGHAMAQLGSHTGAMASIQASQSVVKDLMNCDRVVIAGLNSPQQTIISGAESEINTVVNRAQKNGLKAVVLPVSHAFHSSLVAAAVQPLNGQLEQETFQILQRTVVSTVSGTRLTPQDDLRSLLCRQVTAPVRFIDAIQAANPDLDLWIEVGPGQVLGRLAQDCVRTPTISLDVAGPSLKGGLMAVGATYAMGAPIHHEALFHDRFSRPFALDWHPKFLGNPCESVPEFQPADGPSRSSLSDDSDSALVSSPELTPRRDQHPELEQTVDSSIDLVRQLVADRTELPISAIQDHHRLLSDLHLNSITVGQLVAEAAKFLNLSPTAAPTNYADATVVEIAQALNDLVNTGGTTPIDGVNQPPSGLESWVRPFTLTWDDCPIPTAQYSSLSSSPSHFSAGQESSWHILSSQPTHFEEELKTGLHACPGQGVMVVLSQDNPVQAVIEMLWSGTQQMLSEQSNTHLVVVQDASLGGGVARTFHLENPHLTTCVVTMPIMHSDAVNWILTEVLAAQGYSEARYDLQGNRQVPRLALQQLSAPESEMHLTPADILMVTGGGKGIAAECALALARDTGVRLVLLGRSSPENDEELSRNLSRMQSSGIELIYLSTDVTELPAVERAVQDIETQWGPITALLHGAGINHPQLLTTLTAADFHHTFAPKVQGLNHLLSAIHPQSLKLLVTFGSIIAYTGLRGEADYAFANEWLANRVEQFQGIHPNCRCLNLAWSIWSGVGMGERLGRVDALVREGITPISPDRGIAILRQLVAHPLPMTSIIIASRLGTLPTLTLDYPDLPLLRFLEETRVFYPGIELVVDCDLSIGTDPYLNDHVYDGEYIFPAVMGLEAMTQVARALTGISGSIAFETVLFDRPVVVPREGTLKIRIAAMMRSPHLVDVVIRSEQTTFLIDHFKATCSIAPQGQSVSRLEDLSDHAMVLTQPRISLNPEQDLYGNILFHSGRFQRLRGYQRLHAQECMAELFPHPALHWFSAYLPGELYLGDPGARDAAIHALQACIPHVTLLPVGVERITIDPEGLKHARYIHAQERSRLQNTFVYDMEILNEFGQVLERWEALTLKVISPIKDSTQYSGALLGPYLEREIQALIPEANMRVVVDKDATATRTARKERALKQIVGITASLQRRLDGKPEVLIHGEGGVPKTEVSISHCDSYTIVVGGDVPVGCDIESVKTRSPQDWNDLLGAEKFLLTELLVDETGQTIDVCGTCVWSAMECLKKVGFLEVTPLVLESTSTQNWIQFNSGSLLIATHLSAVPDSAEPLIISLLIQQDGDQQVPGNHMVPAPVSLGQEN